METISSGLLTFAAAKRWEGPAIDPVGNQVPRYSGWKQIFPILHYRKDWAVRTQVPRYSGWKLELSELCGWRLTVRTQVPRYSGFKTGLLIESDRFIELLSSVVFIANA